MSDVQVPHLAFPFRFGVDGAARVVEQDTQEEVEQGVRVLLLTEKGERLEVPDFGIADMTFTLSTDLEAVRMEAAEWDERAQALFVEENDRMAAMVRHLLIQVTTEEE